jgi:arylformamidase
MKLYDISVSLFNGLPAFPGDPRISIEPVLGIKDGDGANVSRIVMAGHSGTHVDAPSHMLEDGDTMDSISLPTFMGKAYVADLQGVSEIGARELNGISLRGVERLLFKTDNSGFWEMTAFQAGYVSLNMDGAEFLVRQGIRLVGIDYLSIERFDGDGSVHRTLMRNGIVILEGLDLSRVEAGHYELFCLPLRIAGGDGAPARAVLREMEGGRCPV